MIRKQKKSRKQRGAKRTHGYGAGKKHRGAGHRGGKGNAGKGKRGQQKRSIYLAAGIKTLGKSGIRRKKISKPKRTINVQELSQNIERLVSEGKAKKKDKNFQIDLSELKYQKLLGAGEINKPVEVKVDLFSKKAEEKINKAGGKIVKEKKPIE